MGKTCLSQKVARSNSNLHISNNFSKNHDVNAVKCMLCPRIFTGKKLYQKHFKRAHAERHAVIRTKHLKYAENVDYQYVPMSAYKEYKDKLKESMPKIPIPDQKKQPQKEKIIPQRSSERIQIQLSRETSHKQSLPREKELEVVKSEDALMEEEQTWRELINFSKEPVQEGSEPVASKKKKTYSDKGRQEKKPKVNIAPIEKVRLTQEFLQRSSDNIRLESSESINQMEIPHIQAPQIQQPQIHQPQNNQQMPIGLFTVTIDASQFFQFISQKMLTQEQQNQKILAQNTQLQDQLKVLSNKIDDLQNNQRLETESMKNYSQQIAQQQQPYPYLVYPMMPSNRQQHQYPMMYPQSYYNQYQDMQQHSEQASTSVHGNQQQRVKQPESNGGQNGHYFGQMKACVCLVCPNEDIIYDKIKEIKAHIDIDHKEVNKIIEGVHFKKVDTTQTPRSSLKKEEITSLEDDNSGSLYSIGIIKRDSKIKVKRITREQKSMKEEVHLSVKDIKKLEVKRQKVVEEVKEEDISKISSRQLKHSKNPKPNNEADLQKFVEGKKAQKPKQLSSLGSPFKNTMAQTNATLTEINQDLSEQIQSPPPFGHAINSPIQRIIAPRTFNSEARPQDKKPSKIRMKNAHVQCELQIINESSKDSVVSKLDEMARNINTLKVEVEHMQYDTETIKIQQKETLKTIKDRDKKEYKSDFEELEKALQTRLWQLASLKHDRQKNLQENFNCLILLSFSNITIYPLKASQQK